MTQRDFAPIADSLRLGVISFYAERGERLDDAAGVNTLETNSGYVERRAAPLLELLSLSSGHDSLEGMQVLDLGCGFGALSLYFAARGGLVTGIDPIEDRLGVGRDVAAAHELPVRFEKGMMEELELPNASFDLAVQNNSLCYVVAGRDRDRALRETFRVLRPGGYLIMRNPNRWHPVDQFTGLPLIQLLPTQRAARAAELMGKPRSTVRLTSPPAARRELRSAGFAEVAHVASPASRWPRFAKPFARYQHLLARRPK
jgi:ubiquinone/menaquinone biosynthesis C-methylase UbiE